MAREINRLNDPLIRSLKPQEKDQFVADGNGLWLRVRATGSKAWIIRRKSGGRQMVTTLGSYPTISLRDAREAAMRDRARHPLVGSTNVTVNEAADEWLAQLRRKSLKSVETYINYLRLHHGNKRVRDLSRGDVLRMIEKYRVGRPVAGNRMLATFRQFFGWCHDHEFCDASPAAHLKRDTHGSKEKTRARVLTDAEIKTLMRLEGRHAPLLQFLLLVPCRIAEAQGMEWSEIEGARWTIPAKRTKSGAEHWFALPPAALKLLGPRSTGKVFAHQTSPTAVQAWLRRWQKFDDNAWTPHDLRRTARTRATGSLGVRESVAERWLGHSLDGLLGVYDQSMFEPERVKLARDWGSAVKKLAG